VSEERRGGEGRGGSQVVTRFLSFSSLTHTTSRAKKITQHEIDGETETKAERE